MSSATNINLADLAPTITDNINHLINVKKQIKAKSGLTADITDKIPFEIKSYSKWLAQLDTLPSTIIPITYITPQLTTLKYPAKLITKITEIAKYGHILDIPELCTQYSLTNPIVKPNITLDGIIPTSQGHLDVTGHPDMTSHLDVSGQINVATIEAIPKKLADEGARPDDSDPVGQRRYDLQLIWGIGPRRAEELEKLGVTLQLLHDEWNRFIKLDPEKGNSLNNGILRTPMPGNDKPYTLNKRIETYNFTNLAKLTYDQIMGIKYFHDIAIKIAREEIISMEKLLQLAAKNLNPNFIAQSCGSYRRGRERSGDVDCLLVHQGLLTKEDIEAYEAKNGHILSAYAALLTKLGFLRDHLSCGPTKYMGLCRLPNKKDANGNIIKEYTVNRRIDIRFVPYNAYGTALLYFTGSYNFNIDMRNRALSKGYTLCEYGLFKLAKDTNGKFIKDSRGKTIKSEQIKTQTEEDVFKLVGMTYVTPKDRDI